VTLSSSSRCIEVKLMTTIIFVGKKNGVPERAQSATRSRFHNTQIPDVFGEWRLNIAHDRCDLFPAQHGIPVRPSASTGTACAMPILPINVQSSERSASSPQQVCHLPGLTLSKHQWASSFKTFDSSAKLSRGPGTCDKRQRKLWGPAHGRLRG
jgi:hypothetical protein